MSQGTPAPAAVPDDALDRCLRNIYDHIQHEAYNDALSSTLEAQKHAAAMRARAMPDDVALDAAQEGKP